MAVDEKDERLAKVIDLLPRAAKVWEENPPPPPTPQAIALARKHLKISA